MKQRQRCARRIPALRKKGLATDSLSTDNAAASVRMFGDAREDLLEIPDDTVTIDLIACADKNWQIGGNTRYMERLAQIFTTLQIAARLRTVVLGCGMQRELQNGGILATSNIVYSPEREVPKRTGLRLMYVDSARGLTRTLTRLQVPHAWVIGGAGTFADLEPYCRRAYVIPDSPQDGAGKLMPALDTVPGWELERTFERLGTGGRCAILHKYTNRNWVRLDGPAAEEKKVEATV